MSLLSLVVINKLIIYLVLIAFTNPLLFIERLRNDRFPPEFRPESGFGFSQKVYPWFGIDYSDPVEIRKQVRLLKQAGITSAQIYFNWSEVVERPDGTVTHSDNWRIPDMVVGILTEEGTEIHAEIFTHFTGVFESGAKNSNSILPINVPVNQVAPLGEIIRLGKIKQFRSWARQLVSRYPQIKFWGFLNEADSWLLNLTAEELVQLQNAYYEEVKSVNSLALVGSASPTFPELIAPVENLHPVIFEALGYQKDSSGKITRQTGRITKWLQANYNISYPEYYSFWRKFYEKSGFDVVQIHQLGATAWNPRGPWYDDGFDASGNFIPEKSSRWKIIKAGVDNIRKLTGNKIITSQVGIGTDLPIGHPDYWKRADLNFREAASGKYGYDFLDIYHLRQNFIVFNGEISPVADTFLFTEQAEPSPLYFTIQNKYFDYQARLKKELLQYFLTAS